MWNDSFLLHLPGGRKLQLSSVRDDYHMRIRPEELPLRLSPSIPHILLSHVPDIFPLLKPGTADAPVEEFHSDDRLLEVADEALANAGITHITGIIASGNYFVDTPQKVEEVIRLTGADAVEMEGAAVAQVAARNNVPALVIRALSDNADTDYEVFKEFDISEYADTAARLAVDIVKRL